MKITWKKCPMDSCDTKFLVNNRYIGLICNRYGDYSCVADGAAIGFKSSLKEAKKCFVKWYKAKKDIWGN